MLRPGDGHGVPAFVVRRGEPRYPGPLLDLRLPPDRLFGLGDHTLLSAGPRGLVSIVGTRNASPYGVRVATEIASAFASRGVTVVSGMARGIDSAAHRGALDAGGRTVAVLGTGVDVPYPASNRALHGTLVSRGLVLSESPPGTHAAPGCFPRRNRIIAALAELTIVIEAPHESGAINTANQALDLGRTVAAVPGPIDTVRSAGSNRLIRDGAQVIASVSDALGLYGLAVSAPQRAPKLGPTEAGIWDVLAEGAASVEILGQRLGLSLRQVLEAVSNLELNGLVRQNASGEILRRTID